MTCIRYLDRREFLRIATLAALAPVGPAFARDTVEFAAQPDRKADYTLRIRRATVELAPNHVIATTVYNDQFPGPLLRLTEGRPRHGGHLQ